MYLRIWSITYRLVLYVIPNFLLVSVPLGRENLLLYLFLWLGFFSYHFGAGLSSTMFALANKALALAATHSFCLCLQWWFRWSNCAEIFLCVCISVVTCSQSKIAENFLSVVPTWIHQARLCSLLWYLQETSGICLYEFLCPCLQSSPSDWFYQCSSQSRVFLQNSYEFWEFWCDERPLQGTTRAG